MPKLLHLLAPYRLEVWKRDEADLTITTLRLGLCGYAAQWPLMRQPLRSVMRMQCHVMSC
jgi:hypothetical protein